MVRSLNIDDQHRLVEAVLRIEAMRVRRDRDLHISALERELGHALRFVRHDQDQLDVWALVDACLIYPGAAHTLIKILEAIHPGSLSVYALSQLVDELLPDPWLEQAERRDLHQLVALLERAVAGAAYPAWFPALYRRVVGPAWPPLNHEINSLHDIVALLEEMPARSDGVPPLLLFVADIAAYGDGSTARACRDWTRRQAELLRLDSRLLWRHLERAATESIEEPPDTYLIIECRPDAVEADRYLVTVWLQVDDQSATTLRCDDQPMPLSRLPELLEWLLVTGSSVVDCQNSDLTIEFILPRILLDHPFDQIKINVAGFEHRIGIKYPVVVRSLDRMQLVAIHHGWRRKWSWLRGNPVNAPVCLVERQGQYGQEELYSKLSDVSPAVLAVAFPPWGVQSEDPDEHWVGLLAGIPIIVWCRDGRDPARFANEFKDLLAIDLMTLPQRTMHLRRQALSPQPSDSSQDHLGLQLTLMFDDADRIPELYIRLRPPA